MNKEQQELLDESYKDYFIKKSSETGPFGVAGIIPTKDEFINNCKNNPEFSERWGLNIEERELSWEERRDLLTPEQYDGAALNKYGHKDCGFGDISPFTDKVIHYWMNLHNIPSKLITITYNDKTIESYE
jgi:hypothetical protein